MTLASKMPLYEQLIELFSDNIDTGVWPPDSKIPTEHELAATYSVSRTTVRAALGELARDGRLRRSRAKGTFVIGPKPESDIRSIQDLTRGVLALAEGSAHKVVSQSVVPATPTVARKLRIAVNSSVTEVRRLRLELGQPIALATFWLPTERFPGLEARNFAGKSFYPFLRENYNVAVKRTQTWLEPTVATEHEATLLDVWPGTPCMMIERLVEEENAPIVSSKMLLRGDKCRYVISWEN